MSADVRQVAQITALERPDRKPGNQRLSTVHFPTSVAVLPAIPALIAAVCRAALEARHA